MAFSKKSEKLVNNLIQAEYENACENYGDKFNSVHEAYAVLLEEIEEAKDEIKALEYSLSVIWQGVKENNNCQIESYLQDAKYSSVEIIKEFSQVVAVANKFENTLQEKSEKKYCSIFCDCFKKENGRFVCYGQKNSPYVNLGDECYYNKWGKE